MTIKNIRLSLKLILERNEYEVALAEGPKEAMQIVLRLSQSKVHPLSAPPFLAFSLPWPALLLPMRPS